MLQEYYNKLPLLLQKCLFYYANGGKIVIIRQSTERDVHLIRELLIESQWFTYKNLYASSYIQAMIDRYYNIERIKDEINMNADIWHGYYVSEQNCAITGVIGGGLISEFAAEIYVFYINPQMRGNGIGTRLLDFFTKIQKHTYGASEQWVAVAKGNDYGIPFYEARGFIFQHEERSYGTTKEDLDFSLKYKRNI